MNLFDYLKYIFRRRKQILTPIDPDLIRRDKVIQSQAQQIAGLQSQIAKILATQREEQENQIQEDKQELIRQDLEKQEKEIKKQKFGDSFSLNKFFYHYFNNKKFREKLEICDKDDKVVFGKFGQFLILESGRLALTDENGNILSYGKALENVIYKPSSFLNQIKRGRILIPYDSNYNPALDFEEIEVNDIVYDYEKKVYKLTQEAKQTAKELLIEKDKDLRKLKQYADRLENVNLDLKKDNDELKRSLKLQKGQIEGANSELSQVMEQFSQYQQSYGDTQRKVTSLTETKAMYEDIINRQEYIMKSLLDQLEEAGDKTYFKKAYVMVKDVMDYAKSRLPQQITVKGGEIVGNDPLKSRKT